MCKYRLGRCGPQHCVEVLLGRKLNESERRALKSILAKLPEESSPLEETATELKILAFATKGEEARQQAFFELVRYLVLQGLDLLDYMHQISNNPQPLSSFRTGWLISGALKSGELHICQRHKGEKCFWDVVLVPKDISLNMWMAECHTGAGNPFRYSMAYGLLAPAVFNLFRTLPAWKGQLVSRRDTDTDPSLYFPARYYDDNFGLSGTTLRKAAANPVDPIRTRKINRRDNGYYYPDVHRRYPSDVPKEPPKSAAKNA